MAFAFICLRQYDKFKGNEFYLVMALLPCFCLFAFRHYDVGVDNVRYAIHIENAKYGIENYFLTSKGYFRTEPLSKFISFISYYWGGIQCYFILTSLVQYVFIFLLLQKFHKNGLNVAIFFLIFFSVIELRTCTIIRNGLALSVAFYAYSFLFEKKQKYFWFFSALAIGFHNSAIINIPIYFICSPIPFQENRWKIYQNIFIKIMALLSVALFIYAMKNGLLSSFITDLAHAKYAHYEMKDSWGLGNLITRLPFLLFFLFYLKDLKNRYGQNIAICFYFMIFDLILSMSRYVFSDLERLTQYSSFGELVLISIFYDFIRERVRFPFQFVYFLIVVAYYSWFMYRWAILDHYGLMPFKFMEF